MRATSRDIQTWRQAPHPHDYATQGRTERIIASARVILSIAGFVTLWLDPTQPPRYANAFTFLAGYAAYSLALAALAWRTPLPPRWGVGVMHGIDLIVFTILIALFEGPAISPFFVFFVFSLFSATLRWNWQGCLWTAGAGIAAFAIVGLHEQEFVADEIVYLSVVAIVLAYMGAFEQQRRRQIAALGVWPPSEAQDLQTVVRNAIEYGAGILKTPRVVLAFEEAEEPGCYLAYLGGGQAFALTRESSLAMPDLVPAVLRDSSFLCPDLRAGQSSMLVAEAGGTTQWARGSVNAQLQLRFSIDSVLSVPLVGEDWVGRLFFLDAGRTTVDYLSLARVVGQQVGARLDHHYLVQRLQQAAVTQERMGLGRDLHDGLLQSLTGMALQVHSALRFLREHPLAAEARLATVQEQILSVQEHLLSFIGELRSAPPAGAAEAEDLRKSLRDMCQRVERQWGRPVSLQVCLDGALPSVLAQDVLHLAHEALANVVRHSGAAHVAVDVEATDTHVRLGITDDGHGFSFTGRFGLDELLRTQRGPVSIRERVLARHGQLLLTSSDAGVHLDIRLPRNGSPEAAPSGGTPSPSETVRRHHQG